MDADADLDESPPRLGLVPSRLRKQLDGLTAERPLIWVHAVSVGEVLAVSRLVKTLDAALPEYFIAVSTTTRTGQTLARERFGAERVFYCPLDLPWAVRAYLNALRPRLLLLDEPASALDPETREHFFSTLLDLNRVDHVTVILVTHDIGSIGQYAGRLLYLDRKLIFYGSFDDFCRSDNMAALFGGDAQHIICHQHTR